MVRAMTMGHMTQAMPLQYERRILHGLSCEWETARWYLPPQLRCRLRRPLFSLGDMHRRLGQWDAVRREIRLSRSFVTAAAWPAVREVLFHETAHQIAHEVLGARSERPHGDGFREACRMLGISPAATMPNLPGGHETGSNDHMLAKIKKLLALTKSPHPFEAEAAMQKAQQLMEKHQVDFAAVHDQRTFVSRLVGAPALRHSRDCYVLAGFLQDYYYVQGIWVPVYVLAKGKMGRVLEVSGTPENVEIAGYVHDCIRTYIARQWRHRNGRNRRGACVDFAVGVLEGFRKKCEAARSEKPRPADPAAVVALADTLLSAYVKEKYPSIRTRRRQSGQVDAAALRAGRAAGEALVIQEGITESAAGLRRIAFAPKPPGEG